MSLFLKLDFYFAGTIEGHLAVFFSQVCFTLDLDTSLRLNGIWQKKSPFRTVQNLVVAVVAAAGLKVGRMSLTNVELMTETLGLDTYQVNDTGKLLK